MLVSSVDKWDTTPGNAPKGSNTLEITGKTKQLILSTFRTPTQISIARTSNSPLMGEKNRKPLNPYKPG